MGAISLSVLILVALVSFRIIRIYNELNTIIEVVNTNKQCIDMQLDNRFKQFSLLILAIQHIPEYDNSPLKNVPILHQHAVQAKKIGDFQAEIKAENSISSISVNLHNTFEKYPELRVGKNVMQLQEDIINTESKLSYAKQTYNQSVTLYDSKKKSFFESMLIRYNKRINQSYLLWL